jgi:hypothetical protein
MTEAEAMENQIAERECKLLLLKNWAPLANPHGVDISLFIH